MEDMIFIDVYGMVGGIKVPIKTFSMNEVTKILTNALMDGIGKIIEIDEEKGNDNT